MNERKDTMVRARSLTVLAAVLLAGFAPGTRAQAEATQESAGRILTNAEILANKDRTSYAIGVSIGRKLKQQGGELVPDAVVRGLTAALADARLDLTEDELQATIQAVTAEMTRRQRQANGEARAALVAQAARNQKAGDEFLAANRGRPGVVTLPSGLQYRILKAGDGPRPSARDAVVVNYRGTLLDGTEFDASAARGGPATFTLDGVIPGWAEALRLMNAGSKWELFIPPKLAYGTRGAEPQVGPNATLVFEVELLRLAGPSDARK